MRARHEGSPGSVAAEEEAELEEELITAPRSCLTVRVCHPQLREPVVEARYVGEAMLAVLHGRVHPLPYSSPFPLPLAEWARCSLEVLYAGHLLWFMELDEVDCLEQTEPFFRDFEGEDRWQAIVTGGAPCNLSLPGADAGAAMDPPAPFNVGLAALLRFKCVLPRSSSAPPFGPTEEEEVVATVPLRVAVEYLFFVEAYHMSSRYQNLKALDLWRTAGRWDDGPAAEIDARLARRFRDCLLVLEVCDEEGRPRGVYSAPVVGPDGAAVLPSVFGPDGAPLACVDGRGEFVTDHDLVKGSYRLLLLLPRQGRAVTLDESGGDTLGRRALFPFPYCLHFALASRHVQGTVHVRLELNVVNIHRKADIVADSLHQRQFDSPVKLLRCLEVCSKGVWIATQSAGGGNEWKHTQPSADCKMKKKKKQVKTILSSLFCPFLSLGIAAWYVSIKAGLSLHTGHHAHRLSLADDPRPLLHVAVRAGPHLERPEMK